MTDDPERRTWIGRHVQRILFAAVDRQPERVLTDLDAVADRYGQDGMFALCYSFSYIVQHLTFPDLPRGDGSLTGTMLTIQQLPGADDDPAALWAARFVVAYANGDADNTNALFFGSADADPDAHMQGVIALIAMAADLARNAEGQSTTRPSDN